MVQIPVVMQRKFWQHFYILKIRNGAIGLRLLEDKIKVEYKPVILLLNSAILLDFAFLVSWGFEGQMLS